jgi:hypothetical protein
MIDYRPIASLTLDEARVLLGQEAARALLGKDLNTLPGAGDIRLIDSLSNAARGQEFWIRYLSGLYVSLLDVNLASRAALLRIPELLPAQANLLLKTRPYFTLTDLSREGQDLQEVARLAAPYLAHEGYMFVDKPRGKMVELIPTMTGIIVRYPEGVNRLSFGAFLKNAGLLEVVRDRNERLSVCHWDVPLLERPRHLRALKESELVATVAPFLEDAQGETRLVYLDRLDLALHENAHQADWEHLLDRFRLSPVQQYTANYGSVRVEAPLHDLGALYRTQRVLTKEPAVHFVEPTYMVIRNS